VEGSSPKLPLGIFQGGTDKNHQMFNYNSQS